VFKDKNVSGVVIIALLQIQTLNDGLLDVIRDCKMYGKPFVVCITGGTWAQERARKLEGWGIPTYPMPERAITILIIEDEPSIVRFLRTTLGSQGYDLYEAGTGQVGLAQAATCRPDLILLDLGLPDVDGIEVIRRIRAWSAVPIVIISARGQESDKVTALDLGADDYLTKPFGVPELMARIRAALRRAARVSDQADGAVFVSGDLKVDLAGHLAFLRGHEVDLTPIEFRLLAAMIRQAGKVITHRQLLTEVWGPHLTDESSYLRVFVHQLRRKLEDDPARPKYILTETGVGYRFKT
jgi:two-component system KDP operon response regulator KdpE